MHNDETHFGIVDRPLRRAAPRFFCRFIVRKNADRLDRTRIELENAGRFERAEFRREWVRIEPRAGDRSLIEVSGQGRSVRVGRYVNPELRLALAREIRMALRGA